VKQARRRLGWKSALACAAFLGGTAYAQPVRILDWTELRPPSSEVAESTAFDRLTSDQTELLREIVRARTFERMGVKLSDEGRVRMAQAERTLAGEGVNVDALLAERDAIIKRRTEAAESPVASLDGGVIRIAGYVLPVAVNDKGETEFLLVPWVGACSHAATPPPNQVVRVTAATPIAVEGPYAPVTVGGRLAVSATTRSLHLVDGTIGVRAVYAMEGATVSPVVREGGR
jgi:hypothetical protein